VSGKDAASRSVTEDTSDGYHTFRELYDHRITLYLALCRLAAAAGRTIWKSKVHSDGSSFEGWFVLGVGEAPGEQITYHLPLSRWDEADFPECVPPPFDGHSSADVLERLKRIEALAALPAVTGDATRDALSMADKSRLWDALHTLVMASGGNPGNTSVARQLAVIETENAVAAIITAHRERAARSKFPEGMTMGDREHLVVFGGSMCWHGRCPNCGNSVEGEWFDGSEIRCFGCEKVLVAACSTDAAGVHHWSFDVVECVVDDDDDAAPEPPPAARPPVSHDGVAPHQFQEDEEDDLCHRCRGASDDPIHRPPPAARPVCRAWCGGTGEKTPIVADVWWSGRHNFCSRECRKAGRPLNPPPAVPEGK